jgi:uncharacterized protein YqeY
MALRDEISKEITGAMRAGDKLRLSALRLLLAAVTNKEQEIKKEVSDEDVHAVAATLSRQRRDSAEQFKKGGREDLAEKEECEIEILKDFMPPQLSTEELRGLVEKARAEIAAEGMKDMGRLMKAVMGLVSGRADGKAVQEIVKEALGGTSKQNED